MKSRKYMDKTILPADNILCQMQPYTNSWKVFDRRRAVEALEKFRDFRLFDADTRISDYYFGIVSRVKSSMEICPFSFVYFTALSRILYSASDVHLGS